MFWLGLLAGVGIYGVLVVILSLIQFRKKKKEMIDKLDKQNEHVDNTTSE